MESASSVTVSASSRALDLGAITTGGAPISLNLRQGHLGSSPDPASRRTSVQRRPHLGEPSEPLRIDLRDRLMAGRDIARDRAQPCVGSDPGGRRSTTLSLYERRSFRAGRPRARCHRHHRRNSGRGAKPTWVIRRAGGRLASGRYVETRWRRSGRATARRRLSDDHSACAVSSCKSPDSPLASSWTDAEPEESGGLRGTRDPAAPSSSGRDWSSGGIEGAPPRPIR
jgi:hypothetical protein